MPESVSPASPVPETEAAEPPASKDDFNRWAAAVESALVTDRPGLYGQLDRLHASFQKGKPFDQNWRKFVRELDASRRRREARVARRPKVEYQDDLPIVAARDVVSKAILDNQVVIVCGETGSGKSTQLPKICLDLGRGIDGRIGHTQPRRIAARSVAARVAEELRVPLGKEVGYQVRFQNATTPESFIKLMTDGILLAETQHDRELRQYDTLIIDEAHERSLNIDFLLGYLRRLLPTRPDLKLIITSATIDAARFSEHFTVDGRPAPVIEVSGRTYPVEVLYRPLEPDENGQEPDVQQAIAAAVAELSAKGPGDLLIFLPTERDIHETAKTLRGSGRAAQHRDILPLYARLPNAEQQRIFQTGGGQRRIVLATNVAESSLTVPGIRYVIDTGTARISRYSPRSKLQRLPIEPVSRASSNQRAGRCGRVGPGVCVRLYSQEDYENRDAFTVPEIQRTNLAQVILQTEALGLGRIEQYPFLDPPKAEAIRDGYRTLFELGAVDENDRLTPRGKELSRLPVDPRIARIVHAGHEEHCLTEVLIIAAGLEVQDPRDRPVEKQQAADEAHAKFLDPESDFLGYLKLWDYYHELKDKLSNSQLRKACAQNFLSYNRLREWSDVYRELVQLAGSGGMKPTPRKNDAAAIHRALLSGFLSSIAMKTDSGEYQVGGGQKVWLWPGSGLAAKKPKWIVAAELVETSRKFLRTAAKIDPAWIEPLAGHLLNRTYSEPHWDPESKAVLAYEKVSLMGLPIVQRRRVQYAKIDPVETRKLFVQRGLVEADYPEPPEFLVKNQQLLEELEGLQARLRRPFVVADEEDRFHFYDAQIPKDVLEGRKLEHWYRQNRGRQPGLLLMTRKDLLGDEDPAELEDQFPNFLMLNQARAPLEYRLEPGQAEDGITVTVPQAVLNQLDIHRLGWLVPGLLEEKVTALLRGLPKDYRRDLVPIPETAAKITKTLRFGEGSIVRQLTDRLRDDYRVLVNEAMLDESKLPPHLRMNVRIVDPSGKPLAHGRDIQELRQQSGAAAARQFSETSHERWNRTGLVRWDFGGLVEVVETSQGGMVLKGYPTVTDEGAAAGLKLRDSQPRALRETRFGVRRLLALALRKELTWQVEHLPEINKWVLQATVFPQPLPLKAHVIDLLAMRAGLEGKATPRNEQSFAVLVEQAREDLPVAAAECRKLLASIFTQAQELKFKLDRMTHPQTQGARGDLQRQAGQLFAPGFLQTTPWNWLAQYPRYLKAILVRIEKLGTAGPRDAESTKLVQPHVERYLQRQKRHAERGVYDPELEAYRWMLEEWRIALFAQELGTLMGVSEAKLEKQWAKTST